MDDNARKERIASLKAAIAQEPDGELLAELDALENPPEPIAAVASPKKREAPAAVHPGVTITSTKPRKAAR